MKSIATEEIRDEWGIPFQIFYGVSDNARKLWSIANARRLIGYAPEDDSEVKCAEEIRRYLTGTGEPVLVREFRVGPEGFAPWPP